jgi:hypothetical protein
MFYDAPDPYLADAYRVTARAVSAQQREDAYVERRYEALLRILDGRSRYSYEVDAGPWAPAGTGKVYVTTDLAWYIADRCDPHAVTVSLLLDRRADLFERYALDRAQAEAAKECAE